MNTNETKTKKYSPEFKLSVIMDMRNNHLSYSETVRRYFAVEKGKERNYYHRVQKWERIYLEEGELGFYVERRGRATKTDSPKKGRPRKSVLDQQYNEDIIAENQRLKMEIDYLKKLSALVHAEEQRNAKKPR